MSLNPKLSIVMPAYNHQQFVGEAIESVLNQTFSEYEFVIIDDGSTDSTADVIHSFKDDRIHYFYQENQDAFNALNNGIAKTKGDFIAILNSDDVYMPKRFETMFEFQAQSQAQCLFSDVIPISDDSVEFEDPEFAWNVWHQNNRNVYFELDDIYAGFLNGNFMVTTSNLLLTSELARKVGGFTSLRYLHDYDYIFRCMLAAPGKIFYMHDQKLLKYRIHDGNTLGEAAITGREQDKQVIRKYMLAACDDQSKKYITTGLDRLIALEHELIKVKNQLKNKEKLIQQKAAALAQAKSKVKPGLLSRLVNRVR
jgi:glycosyltransferase involved in cell wall biosynthesis